MKFYHFIALMLLSLVTTVIGISTINAIVEGDISSTAGLIGAFIFSFMFFLIIAIVIVIEAIKGK